MDITEKIADIIRSTQTNIDHARKVYIAQHEIAEKNLDLHRSNLLKELKETGIPATAEINLKYENNSHESYHGSTFFRVYKLEGKITVNVEGLKPFDMEIYTHNYVLNPDTGEWGFNDPYWIIKYTAEDGCRSHAKVLSAAQLTEVLLKEIAHQAGASKFTNYEGQNFKKWALGRSYKEAINDLLQTTDVSNVVLPSDAEGIAGDFLPAEEEEEDV